MHQKLGVARGISAQNDYDTEALVQIKLSTQQARYAKLVNTTLSAQTVLLSVPTWSVTVVDITLTLPAIPRHWTHLERRQY